MRLKKIIAAALSGLLCMGIMAACGEAPLENEEYVNFTPPTAGEEIAVITVKDYGEIKIKLFPEVAPNAVENFKELAKSGYYDGLKVHRIIENFMMQTGDPNGDGTGGTGWQGEKFEQENSTQLRHFTGAVSYATGRDRLNGSQFFIVNTDNTSCDSDDLAKDLKAMGHEAPDNVIEKYREIGGAPWLDSDYTVFGQVFEGMDVIYSISACEKTFSGSSADGNSPSVPVNDIIVESIAITAYEG